MKKKILSFLLAVITLLHVIPWSVLPAIAEGDEIGIDVSEMEVGKLYNAVFDYSAYADTYLHRLDSDGMMSEYESTVMKSELPQSLIVKLVEEGDTYVYVTNEDWPAKYEEYRFIDSVELIITGPYVAPVSVTCNGQPVDEIVLFEDGKKSLMAAGSEEVTGEVDWTWEILVDPASKTWARIYDKVTNVCDITYALVGGVLDENGEAKVRAVAKQGETAYKSAPITVKMKYAPKPVEDAPNGSAATPAAASADHGATPLAARARGNGGIMLLAESENTITVTINYVKVRKDGTKTTHLSVDYDLVTGYGTFNVDIPSILGYYALGAAEGDNPAVNTNPNVNNAVTVIGIPAGITADTTFTVYYYPKETQYKVIHYVQNVSDDNYVEKLTETRTDTIDAPVPDCHYSSVVGDANYNEAFAGLRHLYYEHTDVAADGSTVIEIYYDREYYTVLFILEKAGAYGQESLYVKYETTIGVNIPKAPGWTFSKWIEVEYVEENGEDVLKPVATPQYSGFTSDHQNVQPTIVSDVIFLADWTGVETTYSIVYWLENANDGNYSVWRTYDKDASGNALKATSGSQVRWDGVVHDEIKTIDDDLDNKPDYQFYSLNTTKTEAQYPKPDGGVIVEGDGSTTVNVYFNRRTYNISFNAVANESFKHDHNNTNDPCVFNAIYCTDPTHVASHAHTAACLESISCGKTEHKHTAKCCDTHVHQLACYAGKAEEFSAEGTFASNLEDKIKDDVWNQEGFLGGISSWIFTDAVKKEAASAGTRLAESAPPQNLQNGYIQVLTNQQVTITWRGILKEYSVTSTYSIPAIYIDGEWYYYSGNLPDGSVETVTQSACSLPNHDHTSGCTYGTKCTLAEHVHTNACYAACPEKDAVQHTAACYGNVCTIPVYDATACNNEEGTDHTHTDACKATVIQLQAKYGQDITEFLPYYLELYGYGLHKSGDANFVGWTYAGTGHEDPGVVRYVKHVTMVSDLCYSEGVTATAVYDPTATNAYVLYYLFESFDQTSGEKDYALDGTARKQFNNGKWYDSDPTHIQLVMWPSAGGTIDGGQKGIEGMTFVKATGNPAPGTLNLTIGTITQETLNAYFYDRNIIDNVNIFNQGHKVENVTLTGDIKYGMSFADVEALIDGFDFRNVPYPSFLEVDAYTFDPDKNWYTTPDRDDYTRINWGTYTVPATDELNLYAIWQPVVHKVYVYEDSTMTTPFATENFGYQEIEHRSYAYAPDYFKAVNYQQERGYTFSDWFYIDPETGEETGFDFNIAITQDMKIYAKWTSRVEVPYKIHFVTPQLDAQGNPVTDENGNVVYVKIADSIDRTAIAGQSRTFRALTGEQLYDDYQKYYFPQVGSHTLQMIETRDAEGNLIANEYTFYYERWATLEYTVRYLEDQTNRVLIADKVFATDKAAVAEMFLPVTGYTADHYYKSLILSVPEEGESSAEKNVITFYYTKNETGVVTAKVRVNHYIANLDGTYALYSYADQDGIVDGTTYYYGTIFAGNNKLNGYTFTHADVTTRELVDAENNVYQEVTKTDLEVSSDGMKYGYLLNETGIEINLYYGRDKVGYTVEYRDDNNTVLKREENGVMVDCRETFTGEQSGLVHGQYATATLNNLWNINLMVHGYRLADPSATEIKFQLTMDAGQNVLVFYYVKTQSEFFYQIVCDDPDSGVDLTVKSEDKLAANSDGSTLKGSTPIESATYYFAGWFKDAECTIPVTADDPVLIDESNRLLPTKTAYEYEGESGELYFSATYYALFLPRSANLTVTVNSGESDSFILTFTGREGTFAEGKTFTVAVQDGVALTVTDVPIGIYDVVSDADWSWRYNQISTDVEVKVQVGGQLTVAPVQNGNDKWLTDDANGTVGVAAP